MIVLSRTMKNSSDYNSKLATLSREEWLNSQIAFRTVDAEVRKALDVIDFTPHAVDSKSRETTDITFIHLWES